jgi:hypothetical protein
MKVEYGFEKSCWSWGLTLTAHSFQVCIWRFYLELDW